MNTFWACSKTIDIELDFEQNNQYYKNKQNNRITRADLTKVEYNFPRKRFTLETPEALRFFVWFQ